MVLFSGIYNWAYLNVYCYGVEMKNWGQIDGENQLITRQLERLNKEREGNDE